MIKYFKNRYNDHLYKIEKGNVWVYISPNEDRNGSSGGWQLSLFHEEEVKKTKALAFLKLTEKQFIVEMARIKFRLDHG